MDELKILTTRLKELRETLQLNQSEFSISIGLKQQTYAAYEKGVNKPPIDVLIKIAQKYNVSLDWLCGIKNNVSLDTYSDVLNLIFKLSMLDGAGLDYDFCKIKEVPFQNYPDIDGQYSCFMMLYFDDMTINDTLVEWKKMFDLYKKGVVDDEICCLWIEKTLKKHESFYNASKNVRSCHNLEPDDPWVK